jgi:hypothetical protein
MSPFSISIHVYILFLPYPPSYTLSLYLTLPLLTTPKQDLFSLPVLHLVKKLFKISIQGTSLWHFHAYMYENPDWFITSIFLLSTLVPFLWWFQQFKNSIFIRE